MVAAAGPRSASVNVDMTTEPDQIRHEIEALLAGLPAPDAPDADVNVIAARLEQANDLLVRALESVEHGQAGGGVATSTHRG